MISLFLTLLASITLPLSDNYNIQFVNQERLPCVVSPKVPRATFRSLEDYYMPELKGLLKEHGALLLRGCGVRTPEEFTLIVTSILKRYPIDYKGGEGSRTKIIEGVYTSTEAPPEFKIPLHNELSCTDKPPQFFCLFCQIAPQAGTGQTLLGRTRDVTDEIAKHEHLWSTYDGKSLKYISRHPSEGSFFTSVNPAHKPWQEVFETNDRAEVEAICQEKGFTWRWLGDWIEITRIAPATLGPDGHLDFPYWFNQAHLYHPNPRKHGGYLNDFMYNLLYIHPETRPYDIEFTTGEELDEELVYQVYDILDQKTIYFDWQAGDVLILDNFKTMHGKAPHDGPRRVLVSFVP